MSYYLLYQRAICFTTFHLNMLISALSIKHLQNSIFSFENSVDQDKASRSGFILFHPNNLNLRIYSANNQTKVAASRNRELNESQ